ncbi:hypothetical protein K431DRAFT_291620 [Polychaeton citri CBS 116435]|uniref:Uncharacterized protein n=1 Tax=Polychaeton citri CBS 116435 TaxID=1314669 RepID=A0A9P4UTA5_9PEZI|nr:hypothetical protein K431DRAFT_291620 [Polychaeton citri CBS 116435]
MTQSVKQRQKGKVTSTGSNVSDIPSPFEPAPAQLQSLLSELDPSKVYLTHIDYHQRQYKRQIFLIPVLLNTAIAVLLFWRLYTAFPQYLALAQTFTGVSEATVDVENTTRKEQIWILLKRAGMFLFDFCLVRFVLPWPIGFFMESPANPVTWRLNLGFRDAEVVARVSRDWGTEDLMKGVRQGQENAFFKTRILPAIERGFVREKTGYLMMNESWDLDFELMIYMHILIEKQKAFSLMDIDKLVFAHLGEGKGWVTWKWEAEDQVSEARRGKILAFKERLTSMGKESVFWKWAEIVEEERLKGEESGDGMSMQRQEKVAERVQRVFGKNGLDFEEIIRSVGGLDDMVVGKSG